jgi:predicted phosphodiesterase
VPRLGIIADVHEDIDRLRQAFDLLASRGCDEYVCLGDLVGFSVPYYAHFATRDAQAVVELVRERCSVVVAGNHDHFAVRKIPEHRAGVDYPESWYALPYRERARRLLGRVCLYEAEELSPLLDDEGCAYLRSLPEFVVRDYSGVRIMFSHYAYPDLTGIRVLAATAPEQVVEHLAFMDRHRCTVGVSGHDHVDGVRTITADTAELHGFVKLQLNRGPSWVNGPAVANGTHDNGALILDTDTLGVEAIPLGSERRRIPPWRGEWRG